MFEFSTEFAILYAALFLFISVLIPYYFYRKIVIKPWKKYVLISLRALALFLLLMIFVQPVLLSLHGKGSQPVNIVLIDNSRSLELYDSSASAFYTELSSNRDLKVFSFSGSIGMPQPDSFSAYGPYTNLSVSLENLKLINEDNPFNSVTVISDGNFNEGGNPVYNAKTFNCPFISVPIGDSLQKKDIVIYNAAYNKTAYINTANRIKVFFKAFNTVNENAVIKLEKEGSIISEKQVPLNNGNNNYTADFDITETAPGKYKYRLIADNLPGEITYKNNYYDFYIEFLDNKIRLLFISGGPSYDNAVISGIVKRFSNFETTVKTLKTPSEFYEGNIDAGLYKDLSAIMLLNFPTVKYTGNALNEIYANSKKFNIPVIFFAGRNTDYKKLDVLSDIIPFSFSQTSSEKTVKLQEITGADGNIAFDFGNTPDLFKNIAAVQPKPGTVSVITDKYSGEPLLMVRKNGNNTSAAFLAYGFWQWKLKHNTEKPIEEIIEKSIKLSLNRNKNRKFIITPGKEFFDYTEDVIILAEVFDDNNIPAINADVKGMIKDKSGSKVKDIAFKFQDGKYYTNCGLLKTGDYYIEAGAEIDRVNYANDMNRFTVDTLNKEYLQTVIDYASLSGLANNTGGKTVNYNNLNEVINSVKNENAVVRTGIFKRFNLRENLYYLILVIFLFSIEWVMKKRNNIP